MTAAPLVSPNASRSSGPPKFTTHRSPLSLSPSTRRTMEDHEEFLVEHLNLTVRSLGIEVRRGSAHQWAASPTALPGHEPLWFVFVHSGTLKSRRNEQELLLQTSQAAMLRPSRALELEVSRDHSIVILSLPVKDLPLEARGLTLKPLPPSSTLSMMAACLRVMIANAPALDEAESRNGQALIMHHAEILVRSSSEWTAPDSLDLFSSASMLILTEAEDSSLSPESLAGRLNVSLRTLQRVFAAHGTTVADALRQRRLDLLVKLITQRGGDARQAALSAGFSTYSTAEKAFRRRYGVSLQRFALRRGNAPFSPDQPDTLVRF